MKTIKVSSLPLRDVVSDIAKEFDMELKKKCGLFSVRIPDNLGSGSVTGIDFDGGLGLIRYDCRFDMDLMFDYSLDQVHPVKFLYCLKGEISHNFRDEELWHEIPQYKNAIVASSANHGHRVRFKAGERSIYTSLELERRKFQGKIRCSPVTIARSWRNMLNDLTARKTFYHDGFYSLQLSKIFEKWDRFDDMDFLKSLFLEGMAYDIMVLQIKQFQDDLKSEGKKTLLRRSELNQMQRAIDIINKRLEDLPTISDIASEVGLTASKLQQGFKELFGQTVNSYTRDKRLETARALLLNTDDTISNISMSVGIGSVSYFSKIFREAYGVAPSEYQRSRERKKINPDDLVPR